MKKSLLAVAVFVMSSGYIFSQDIILKQDGSEIKAKVIEITDQQVKYKEFDFQSGPTRNINTSDVFMITYENGKKEVFNKQNSTQQQNIQQQSNNSQQQSYDSPQGMTLSRFKSMRDREQYEYFEKYVGGNIFQTFQSGTNLTRTGKGLFIPWIILSVAGFGMALGAEIDGVYYYNSYYGEMMFDESMYILSSVGWSLFALGQTFTIVSIPLRAIGGAKKKSAQNEYINTYFKATSMYQPTLDFGMTKNGGFGLILKF